MFVVDFSFHVTSAKWHHYGTKRTFVTFTLFLVDTVLMSIFTLQTCKNRTENLKNWRQKLIKFTSEKYTSIYLHFDHQNDTKIDLISPPIRATFLSKNVRTCQKMSENVRRCQKMSEDVRRCQKMSENVRRCHQDDKRVAQVPPDGPRHSLTRRNPTAHN